MNTADRVRCCGGRMVRVVVEGGGDGGRMRVTVELEVELEVEVERGRRRVSKHFRYWWEMHMDKLVEGFHSFFARK